MKKPNSTKIIEELKAKYPQKKVFDLDGRGQHFVCEVEPTKAHPEWDLAVEVIFSSQPHKHLETTQYYKVLSGELKLYIDQKEILLKKNDQYTIQAGQVHWAESKEGCWVEVRSEPGWRSDDHILVEL